MSGAHAITASQAMALAETTAAYGCALVTSNGVKPYVILENITLGGGRIATLRNTANKQHPAPEPGDRLTVGRLARDLGGSLAFHIEEYADAMAAEFAKAGLACQVHCFDAPDGEFEASVVFP